MTPPPDILIRPARADDAGALKAILRDTFESTWLPELTAEAARAFRSEDRPAAYVGARGLLFVVAEVEGEVVGFIDWDVDFVNALHVLSAHARSGVGGRLMDHAEAAMADAGQVQSRLETDTFNTRSRAFYARRGYVEAGRYPDEEWGSGLTTLLLVKDLAARG